jgi:predicted nuclease of predicted toxin-antitoxin system
VKFLIDNLSPLLAGSLNGAGHDAVHLRDVGMQAAKDEAVLAYARSEARVLISADTDFGALLARSGSQSPSVLLIRRLAGRRAVDQSAIIQANDGAGTGMPTSRDARIRSGVCTSLFSKGSEIGGASWLWVMAFAGTSRRYQRRSGTGYVMRSLLSTSSTTRVAAMTRRLVG